MTAPRRSPISGVSADRETLIMTTYPSIASTGFGQLLGRLYDSMPVKIFNIKLSHWLFPLPTAPLAILGYLQLKVFGKRYSLTNRSVQVWKSLGNRMIEQVALSDIDDVAILSKPGQAWYRAADLQLLNSAGEVLMTLEGVPGAEVFRNSILEARAARIQTDASRATIAARQKG